MIPNPGNTNESLIPVAIEQTVIGNAEILNIAIATNHSLALDNYDQIWAWGINQYGQLGNRSTVSSNVPVKTYIEYIDKDSQVK